MILSEIANRRSIREYSAESVADELVTELIKAAQFAPTAHNNRGVEFIVIKDSELKEKIINIVGQPFLQVAPVWLIPNIKEGRSGKPAQDVAIASAFIMLQAEHLGLGTVWKDLSPEWQPKVRELLGLSKNYLIFNILPIGYPEKKPAAHDDSEFDSQKIIFK